MTSDTDSGRRLARRSATIAKLLIRGLVGGSAAAPRDALPREERELWWTRHGYRVARCAACGHVYVNPQRRLEALRQDYGGRYSAFLKGEYSAGREQVYRACLVQAGILQPPRPGARVLDVGCGIGLFLDLARQVGWTTHGLDLSEDNVRAARARGLTVEYGTLEETRMAAGSCAAITLWSVIAHLKDPLATLRRCHALLDEGGWVLVYTVNFDSFKRRVSRDLWDGFTPNHLGFFTARTLHRALRQAGFERRQTVAVREQLLFDTFPSWISRPLDAAFGALRLRSVQCLVGWKR